MATPTIVKADGSREPFAPAKLANSLRRSGASEQAAQDIVTRISSGIEEGMTTEAIYRKARTLLARHEETSAAKYSLRRALFGLGPTGFPFETFLGHLFESEGYQVQVGIELRGKCVTHEVDLAAHKPDHCFIAEAKFHARPGTRSDLQVALYSRARFLDLEGVRFSKEQTCGVTDAYVITNTKFTSAAMEYAACVGLTLISWNSPKEDTLQARIERAGIYPITALPSLSMREKRLLLENGMVLCRDMAGKREMLKSLGFGPQKIEAIVSQSASLCTS